MQFMLSDPKLNNCESEENTQIELTSDHTFVWFFNTLYEGIRGDFPRSGLILDAVRTVRP